MKESFYGSLLSAGVTLATGSFALVSVTAKFVVNFAFCVQSDYTKESWSILRKKLIGIATKNKVIRNFMEKLVSLEYEDSISEMALKNLLHSSLECLKDHVADWSSEKLEDMMSDCLKSNEVIARDYEFLNESLQNNYDSVASILGKDLLRYSRENIPFIVKCYDVQDCSTQISGLRSEIMRLNDGNLALRVIDHFWKNRGSITTYSRVAHQCRISLSYSNHLLNKFDGSVIQIDKSTRPHKIYILEGIAKIKFYERALRTLRELK